MLPLVKYGEVMKNSEFSEIRHTIGLTQRKMAEALCVSTKAIQSFEQGWRNIPSHIEREMLLLSSLNKFVGFEMTNLPMACWEFLNCPEEYKANCLVFKLKARHFCWYISGTCCQGKPYKSWEEKIVNCKKCELFLNMFPTK